MSADTYGEIPTPSESTLAEALRIHDEALQELLDICGVYKTQPEIENQRAVQKIAEKTVASWTESIKLILEDEEIETVVKANMIATLMKGVDERRINHFEKLLGKEDVFDRTNEQEEIAAALLARFENSDLSMEVFILGLRQSYVTDLTLDLNRFLQEVVSLPETPENKIITIRRLVGRHVLDVAKVTAGVWLGIHLSRQTNKK